MKLSTTTLAVWVLAAAVTAHPFAAADDAAVVVPGVNNEHDIALGPKRISKRTTSKQKAKAKAASVAAAKA